MEIPRPKDIALNNLQPVIELKDEYLAEVVRLLSVPWTRQELQDGRKLDHLLDLIRSHFDDRYLDVRKETVYAFEARGWVVEECNRGKGLCFTPRETKVHRQIMGGPAT